MTSFFKDNIKGSKLQGLIDCLTIKEKERFKAFLLSPYHNNNDSLLKLYAYLNDEKQPSISQLNKKDFSYLASALSSKIEEFFAFEQLKQKSNFIALASLDRHINEGLEKNYNSSRKKILKNLGTQKANADSALSRYQLLELELSHFEKQRKRASRGHLQNAYNALDEFYMIASLKLACTMMEQSKGLAAEFETPFVQDIISHLSTQESGRPPLLDMYRFAYLSHIEPENLNHFHALKSGLNEYIAYLSFKDARYFHFTAINFCVLRINKGHLDFVTELLDIYKLTLSNEVAFEDGKLSPWTYKNIVTVALRAKDHGWAKRFIQQYKNRIPSEQRKDAYNFNLANYYFQTKNFSKAQDLLLEVDFSDITYSLNVRELLLKIYFELDEYDAMYSLMKSFRAFLRRDKTASSIIKDSYGNLISFIRKLSNAHVRDYKRLEKIKKEIISTERIADRAWLLAKVDVLLPA